MQRVREVESIEKLKIDFDIPKYLSKDIEVFCVAVRSGKLYDCEMCEVYGSINMAMSSGEITVEQADMIRNYYWYGGWRDEE